MKLITQRKIVQRGMYSSEDQACNSEDGICTGICVLILSMAFLSSILVEPVK
jgi:hypothetical protein